MPELVGNSHSTSPLDASNARNIRSFVPPLNTSPPPVVKMGPQFGDFAKMMAPDFLAGIDIPRLNFAQVIGAGRDVHATGRRHSRHARWRLNGSTDHHRAEVFLSGHIDHSRFRVERAGLPVLRAVPGRTEVGDLADVGLAALVDFRAARFRIEPLEDVLLDVRLAVDEVDRTGRALEEIQIAVAAEIHQSLDCSATAPEVDEEEAATPRPNPMTRSGCTGNGSLIAPVVTSIATVDAV